MSILDGSIAAIPRRLLVPAEVEAEARVALDQALAAPVPPPPDETTEDRFLGGRLVLRQPAHGFRAGLDSVMLAAAVPAGAGDLVLEFGSGAGAAALCLAARVSELDLVGLEPQEDLVALATWNAQANGLGEAAVFFAGSVEAPPPDLPRDHFDHVLMNPPFFVAGRDDASPDAARRTAAIADGGALARWTKAARTHLHAKGTLTAVLPADRLAAMLAALETGFGGLVVFPLWPRAGEAAKRILVQARKGSRAPLVLAPGLVLHAAEGGYTAAADDILRGGAGLRLG
ncbi:MAG: methyltransferase [Alphaproteobacteria bacterium]|nr:methyltransferase [Alphaproteobacteria bacterium]